MNQNDRQSEPGGSLAGMPDPGDLPMRSENVVSREIGGETILIPITSNAGELDAIFTLNEVASRVWQLINGRRSISEIARAITSEFDVDSEQCLNDLRQLIASFSEAGVISVTGH